jgi:drug/metabolite transporter (DMT)-like permease
MGAGVAEKTVRKGGTASYFVLLALACLIWAGQGVAVKYLGRQMGPVAITFVPFWVTTVLLAPLLWYKRRRRKKSPAVTWRDWGQFAVAGVGGQVLAQLGMTWGISRSLASNGAILNLLIPVFSTVLAAAILGERITRLRLVSLGAGLLGVVLLSVGDLRQSSFGDMHYLTGNLMILGGCLGSSFYNVFCKRLLARFQEVEVLIFSYIVASLASVPLLVWVEPFDWHVLGRLDGPSILSFCFLALLMYGASMLLFFTALEHLDVTAASASLYLVPLFGVALAAAFLGERLGVTALVGSAIVLAATLLIVKYDNAS